MRKIIVFLVLLFSFQPFLKADDAFENFVQLFPDYLHFGLRNAWKDERKIEVHYENIAKKLGPGDKRPFLQDILDNILVLGDQVKMLDLSFSGLPTIPDFSVLTGLEKLKLNDNKLTSVEIAGLPNLDKINLSSNQLEHIHFSNLPKLRRLDFSDNRLVRVQIADLPALEKLFFEDNKLIKAHFSNLPKLEKVYCQGNLLLQISFSGAPSLKEVDLSNNYLSEIPEFPEGVQLKKGNQGKSLSLSFIELFPEAMYEKLLDDWQEGNINLRSYGSLKRRFFSAIRPFAAQINVLDISHNEVLVLPARVDVLRQAKQLIFSADQIKEFGHLLKNVNYEVVEEE